MTPYVFGCFLQFFKPKQSLNFEFVPVISRIPGQEVQLHAAFKLPPAAWGPVSCGIQTNAGNCKAMPQEDEKPSPLLSLCFISSLSPSPALSRLSPPPSCPAVYCCVTVMSPSPPPHSDQNLPTAEKWLPGNQYCWLRPLLFSLFFPSPHCHDSCYRSFTITKDGTPQQIHTSDSENIFFFLLSVTCFLFFRTFFLYPKQV